MSEAAIHVEAIKKRYGVLEVLRGIELTIAEGEFAAIIGKSGSGKSTLLGVIAGLEKPDQVGLSFRGTISRASATRRWPTSAAKRLESYFRPTT